MSYSPLSPKASLNAWHIVLINKSNFHSNEYCNDVRIASHEHCNRNLTELGQFSESPISLPEREVDYELAR